MTAIINRFDKWVLAAMVVGVMLRVWRVAEAPFWYDEAFTGALAAVDWQGFWVAVQGDTHPPFYYLLARGWLALFGWAGEVVALRALSVVFGVWGMWLVWGMLEYLGTWAEVDRAALRWPWFVRGVLWLMAVSSWQVHYSQEARQYALLQVLAVAGLWLAMYMGYEDLSWGEELRALGMSLVVWGLMLYTHNYGLFYWLGCLGVYMGLVLWRWWGGRYIMQVLFVPSWILAGVAWAPWAWVLMRQAEQIRGNYWIREVSAGSVLDALVKQFVGFEVAPGLGLAAVVLVVMGLVIGLWEVWRRQEVWMLALVGWAAAPWALAIGGSLLVQPVLLHRGLIGSDVALYAIVCYPLLRAPRWQAVYSVVLALLLVAPGLVGYRGSVEAAKSEGQQLVGFVREYAREGDVVVHLNDSTALGFSWAAPEFEVVQLAQCEQPAGGLSVMTRRGLGWEVVDELPRRGRVWVVAAFSPMIPSCQAEDLRAVTGGAGPVFVERDDGVGFAGVWLVDGTLLGR